MSTPRAALGFALDAAAWLLLALGAALPLLWLTGTVLTEPHVLAAAWPTRFGFAVLLRTICYAAVVAVVATLLALPVGLMLGRGRGVVAGALRALAPIALLLPPMALTHGWARVFRMLETLLPHGIAVGPGSAFDVLRCLFTLAAWSWPIPALCIGLTLRRTSPSIEQQAVLDGALRRVRFALLRPALAVAMAAVFVLASQQAAVFAPSGIAVVATEVELAFATGAFSGLPDGALDQEQRAAAAVAAALPMVLLTTAIAWLALRTARRRERPAAPGDGSWPAVVDAGATSAALAVAVVALTLGGPLFGLLHDAPTRGPETTAALTDATLRSLGIATLAGLSATGIAFAATRRWPRGSLVTAALSFLIGGQLTAIALLRTATAIGFEGPVAAALLLMLAYIARFAWIPLGIALATWAPAWRTLRDMAAVDGADRSAAATAIVWPLAWPALLLGGVLTGVLAMGEVPATVLFTTGGSGTLTTQLMTWMHENDFAPRVEASLLAMVLPVAPMLLMLLLARLARSRAW